MRRMGEVHEDMVGELAERGGREHQRLARNMAARFPDVFRGNRRVHCRSSTYPRVLVSLANFTTTLKGAAPGLEFDFTAGEKIRRVLNGLYFMRDDGGRRAKVEAAASAFAAREVDPAALVRRIFKPGAAVGDPRAFARKLFNCASICQCLESELDGLDLYGYFTKDEIAALSRVLEAEHYCDMGNSAEFGDAARVSARALALDLVARADAAIADDRIAADLRFGHDSGLWPLATLVGIEGPDACTTMEDAWRECPAWKWMPMAANLQLAFYRDGKGGEVLVKILWNEREMRVRGVDAAAWPYYRWSDVRRRILSECGD